MPVCGQPYGSRGELFQMSLFLHYWTDWCRLQSIFTSQIFSWSFSICMPFHLQHCLVSLYHPHNSIVLSQYHLLYSCTIKDDCVSWQLNSQIYIYSQEYWKYMAKGVLESIPYLFPIQSTEFSMRILIKFLSHIVFTWSLFVLFKNFSKKVGFSLLLLDSGDFLPLLRFPPVESSANIWADERINMGYHQDSNRCKIISKMRHYFAVNPEFLYCRHLLHHAFQALMDHSHDGLVVSSSLAVEYKSHCQALKSTDEKLLDRAIQLGFSLGEWILASKQVQSTFDYPPLSLFAIKTIGTVLRINSFRFTAPFGYPPFPILCHHLFGPDGGR